MYLLDDGDGGSLEGWAALGAGAGAASGPDGGRSDGGVADGDE